MKSTHVFQLLSATLIALLLAACGGGGGSAAVSTPAPGKVWGVALAIDIVANAADDPQIAVGANGNAIAVWKQDDGTGINDIWANRYTAGAWGTAERIETGAGDTDNPQIAIDAAGNAIAVWEQFNNTTAEQNIRTARYTVGIGWEQPEAIDSASGDTDDPQIVIDAAGNAIAVWSQAGGAGVYNIYANRYDASTGNWGAAELIEHATGDALSPQIALDAAGNAIAVWRQQMPSDYVIRAARYRFDAATGSGVWEAPQDIETTVATDAKELQIAIDSNGNALAVWSQVDATTGAYTIWANSYAPGVGWFGSSQISGGTGYALSPQVAFDAAGDFVLVWRQHDGTRFVIMAVHFTTTGGLSAIMPIDDATASHSYYPKLAVDPAGNAIVVWEQDDGTGTGINDIWANRYTAGAWGTAERIETGAGDADNAQIAIDVNGNAIVVWAQDNPSTGVDDVMANTYR